VTAVKAVPAQRQRNPRGQGAALRDDIVAAATELLEEGGNEDTISLRAVARRVGISAPAIYAHFADREAILEAVVDDAFADLHAALTAAVEDCPDPVEKLRRACLTYWRFAEERRGRFQLLFARRRVMTDGIPKAESVATMIGAKSFGALVGGISECVEAGRSRSTDPVGDATVLWMSLHGYATLSVTVPYFPWPDRAVILEGLLHRIALVD
jgi:AcrR family transcriptional regulator